jgi:hypothetical protein
MTGRSALGYLGDIALVALVLACVCMSFVELYATAGQTLSLFDARAAFYDIYQAGQNPWAQAASPQETPRLASSGRSEPRH